MSLVNSDNIKVSAILGLGSAFLIFSSIFIPVQLPLFFAGLPIFIAYLAYGNRCGTVTSFLASTALFLIFPLELSLDVFFNMIASAALLGHLSIKNIKQNRKTWWYPESLLLQSVVILSLIAVVLVSTICYSEDLLLKASDEIVKPLLQSNGLNLSPSAQHHIASTIKYAVGIGTLIKMFIILLNFNLAHLITKKMGKNIRPGFDFGSLKTNSFMAISPLICLTVARLFPGISFIFSGLFVVGLFAPMICGFSVIYKLSDVRARFIFSIALLILTLPTMAVALILGIVDSFYPIRKDLSRQDW
jgi:hypothetical protein